MGRREFAALCVLGVLTSVSAGMAQSQMSSGDVKGSVRDLHDAAVQGSTVRLTRIETGLRRETVSDSTGAWQFFIVLPGSYEIRVERPGFAPVTRMPVQVTVGETVSLDLRIEVAGAEEEIFIQDEAPLLEIERTQQSDTITTERIENLPINQRNFLDFAMLTSGVTDAGGLNTFSMPQAPTSKLSFLGQNGRSNSVTVDGVDNNDAAVGAERSTLSQEAVQEFQINRSNFAAEFGRASGGLINIVSKTGSNEVHGSVFSFFRSQSMDARNAFAFGPNGTKADPPFSRLQAGFSIGGPIRRDRTFYFMAYEGLRQRESRFVSFMEDTSFFQPTTSQRALIEALAASSTPEFAALGTRLKNTLTTSEAVYPETVRLLRSNSGVFPFRSDSGMASLRLDHSWTASHRLFARWSFNDTATQGGTVGGVRAPSRGTNYRIRDFSAVVGETAFWGSSRVNEFRFQFANRRYNATPADPLGPEVTINGLVGLGRDFFLPSLRSERRYQWLDNFTIAFGRHVLKFGGDANLIAFDTSTEVFLGGRFIFGEGVPLSSVMDSTAGAGTASAVAAAFPDHASTIAAPVSSLQAFNLGLPLVYQQGFGNPKAKLTNLLFSGFAEDHFHFRQNLTFDFGVRYDVELQPRPLLRDRNNVSPRFGFSYSPLPKLLVRGGYGIYYAPLYEAIGFIGRVLNGQQISQVFAPLSGLPSLGISTTSAQVWNAVRVNGILGQRSITAGDIAALGLLPGSTPPVLLSADAGIVNPYSQQFSLGVEREVAGLNFSAAYVGNRGVKLIRSRNVNLRQVGTNANGMTFGPIDSRILQDNRVESSGSSIYHGLLLNLTKRFRRFYQFQAAYTLSKAIDDTTDFITDLQAANQLDLQRERSLSTFDQRHRLVISGVFHSPFEPGMRIGNVLSGVTLSPILSLSSGHPFNLILGFDANGDTQANTDRPANVGRNTGKGPGFTSLDIRLAKEIPLPGDRMSLNVAVDAFNTFNHVNYSGVNNVVGNMPIVDAKLTGNRSLPASAPLAFTSAAEPRQIQIGLKFKF